MVVEASIHFHTWRGGEVRSTPASRPPPPTHLRLTNILDKGISTFIYITPESVFETT